MAKKQNDKNMNAIESLMQKNNAPQETEKVDMLSFSLGGDSAAEHEREDAPADQGEPRKEPRRGASADTSFVGIRLDKNTIGKLRRLSEQTGFSLSELMRQCIDTSIREYEAKNGEIVPQMKTEGKRKPDTPVF